MKRTRDILKVAYQEKDTQALKAELHRCLGGVCYLRLPRVETALKAFQEAVQSVPQEPRQWSATYQLSDEALEAFEQEYSRGIGQLE